MTPLPIFFIGHKLKNLSERLDTTYRKLRWPQHVRPAFVTREMARVYEKVWGSTESRGLPILLGISPAFRVMNLHKATHEGNSFVGDQPVWSAHRLLHLPSSPCWGQVCDILKEGSTTSLCLRCGKFLSFILPPLLRASIPVNKVTKTQWWGWWDPGILPGHCEDVCGGWLAQVGSGTKSSWTTLVTLAKTCPASSICFALLLRQGLPV